MKCPNCASDVPGASNFCGVCGFDVRGARAVAVEPGKTLALDSSPEADRIRAELDAAMKREPESTMNEAHTPTEFDAPPEVADDQDVDMGSTMIEAPIPEASGAAIPTSETPRSVAQLAPSPAIKATAMDLQSVSKSEAHTVEFSGQETFAAMPAVKPAADGQFRETQWFMAAQDPDHIENIQNVVPSDLEDQYVGGDNKLDTQVREQFSLNVGNSGKSQGSTDVSASSGSARDNTNSGLIVAIIIVAAIGAGAYFMFKG